MILIYTSHNRTVGGVDHCISQLFYFVVKMIGQYPIQINNDYSSLISCILPVTWGVGGLGESLKDPITLVIHVSF
jgi:hypothetical protein